MSTQAQVAKLETLLERIQENRRPFPAAELGAAQVEPEAHAPMTPVPSPESPDAAVRSPKPTPMEQALRVELQAPAELSEPELEISYEDEGPEITIESEVDLAPTAPVGTRAPSAGEPIEAPSLAQPSAPVAKIISQPRGVSPTTFGELLDRTLALRPR